MARWSVWVQCIGLLCAGGASVACGGRALADSPGGAASADPAQGGAPVVTGGANTVDLAVAAKCVQDLTNPAAESYCFACLAQSECCSGRVTCGAEPNAAGSAQSSLSCGLPVDAGCSVSASTASISGQTPNGPVSLSYAWKQQTTGAKQSLMLFFSQSPTAATCNGPSIGFTLEPPYSGLRIAPVVLNRVGATIFAVGYVSFDHSDHAHTSGTFDIYDEGWDVHGKFDAPDCPVLDFGTE